MKKTVLKLVAPVLACLILVLPGALSARERRGADLYVTCMDGHHISGELIALKPNSLLLLSSTGRDESVEIADIATIRILKRSTVWRRGLSGFLIGAAIGGLSAFALRPNDEYPGAIEMLGGFVGGIVGGQIGLILGDSDKDIVIAGKPQASVRKAWAKLARMARRPEK